MSDQLNIIKCLESGINAEVLRHKAIANNMANLETPRYRRIDIKFEELLSKAVESPGNTDIDELEPEIVRPNDTPLKPNGNDVSLENEVGMMIKNSERHKAFLRLLSKKYAQIDTAMR